MLKMLKTAMSPNYYEESISSQTYSNFLYTIVRHVTDCLYAMNYIDEANMFLVWWLRFERYRIIVKSSSDNSRLVSEVKLLLKKPEYRYYEIKTISYIVKNNIFLHYRNNVPLFIEFALLKYQVGKKDHALNILQKLIDGQSVLLDNKPIYLNVSHRTSCTAIYKNLIEILIQSDCKYVYCFVIIDLYNLHCDY